MATGKPMATGGVPTASGSALPPHEPIILYVDPISESSRAIVILAKHLQLPVEIKWVSIKGGEHRTPELLAINPLAKVPFLVDEGMCVPEACAIMTYLARRFQPMVPHAWYPTDLRAKTRVDAGLHWQQRSLRYNTDKMLSERVVKPAAGGPGAVVAASKPSELSEAERGVLEALSQLEYVWLAPSHAKVAAAAAAAAAAVTTATPSSSTSAAAAAAGVQQPSAAGAAAPGPHEGRISRGADAAAMAAGEGPTPAERAARPVLCDPGGPAPDAASAPEAIAATQGSVSQRGSPAAHDALLGCSPEDAAAAATAALGPPRFPAAAAAAVNPPAAVPFSFMGGGSSASLTDLLCACIIEQLRLLDTVEKKPDFVDLISRFPRVRAWAAKVEAECKPHFGEVHAMLRQSVARTRQMLMQQRAAAAAAAGLLPVPSQAAAAAAAGAPAAAASGPAGGSPSAAPRSSASGTMMMMPALGAAAGQLPPQAAPPAAAGAGGGLIPAPPVPAGMRPALVQLARQLSMQGPSVVVPAGPASAASLSASIAAAAAALVGGGAPGPMTMNLDPAALAVVQQHHAATAAAAALASTGAPSAGTGDASSHGDAKGGAGRGASSASTNAIGAGSLSSLPGAAIGAVPGSHANGNGHNLHRQPAGISLPSQGLQAGGAAAPGPGAGGLASKPITAMPSSAAAAGAGGPGMHAYSGSAPGTRNPSFTPSFPALGVPQHPPATPSNVLAAIFNGEPPSAAAAAHAGVKAPAATSTWQVPPKPGASAAVGQGGAAGGPPVARTPSATLAAIFNGEPPAQAATQRKG